MRVRVQWSRAKHGVEGSFAFLKAALSGILLCLSVLPAAAQAKSKNVLVLFSGSSPDNAQILEVMEPAIRSRVPGPVTFYSADLLLNVVNADERRGYWQSQAEAFRHTFANVKLDLVIGFAPPAVLLAVNYRDTAFPGVPIVFTQIGTREYGDRTWPAGVTGLTVPVGVGETIDLALRLHPDTKNVAVIPGQDTIWAAIDHAEMLRRQDKVQEFQLPGPPSPELLAQALTLPPHTVVLFHNSAGIHAPFGGWDLLAGVARRMPTYSPWPFLCFNHGCIGGVYPNRPKEHLLTAEMAARVLNGERPENIPVAHDSNLQVQVDWRELQRWHIPESALPPGSVILYRPPSLWEQYQRYVIATVAAIAVLLLLIAGLLWERARKRKAEALLRESEKRFRVMADTTPSLVWMCNLQGKITYLNEQRLAFTGPDPKGGYGDSWMDYVHPDDRRNVQDIFAQALGERRTFSNEYRLRRSDGVYRWMFDVASPRLNGDGSFAGFIGSAIDVTEQKVAQQALEKVSGQLIEAQENERRRIARDLHDDICQRLALLSMELDQANRNVNESPDAAKLRLKEIRQHCSEIASDVQSLSHELHSSRLDYLGIGAAIRGFCHEFSKQHEVSIEFEDRDVPADLPREISLCLFRVAQEALHNAVKYSGVRKYAVELTATVDEIQLVVSDAGRGFDVEAARGNRGLGLVSMQERVHLVRGHLHVESKPGTGTSVLAVVPLAAENQPPSERSTIEETANTSEMV